MQLLLFIKMQNPSPLVKIGIIALSRNIVCNRARSCSKGEGQQEAIDFPFPTDGCPRAEQWTQWDTQWQSCSPKPQGQTTCSMFALTCGQNIPVVLRTLADRKTANTRAVHLRNGGSILLKVLKVWDSPIQFHFSTETRTHFLHTMLLSDLPSISCPMESPAHFLCKNKTET